MNWRKLCIPALSLALLLSGCGSDTAEPTPEPTPEPQVTEEVAEEDEADVLTREEFVQVFMDYLEALLPDYTLGPGEEEYAVSVKQAGDEVAIFYTENAYAEYLDYPEELESLLSWYGEAMASGLEENRVEAEQSIIYPTMKHVSYVEGLGEMGEDLIYDDYGGELLIMYAVDTPYAIRMMGESDLEELDVQREALYDLALSNLEGLMDGMYIGLEAGMYFVMLDELTYSSALLLADIWNDENFPVDGDIIVGVPDRELIWVVGSEDAETVEFLRGLVAFTFADSGYPVYDGLLRWTGEGFVPYD